MAFAFIFIGQAVMLCMIYDGGSNFWSDIMRYNKLRVFIFRTYVVLSVPFVLFSFFTLDSPDNIGVVYSSCHFVVTFIVCTIHGKIRKRVIYEFDTNGKIT